MSALAERVDGVIGVDTHRETLTEAAVTAVGGLLGQLVMTADAAGYQRLLDFARAHVPGRRCFAVEDAGSYGAGLTRILVGRGEWVIEVERPGRPAAAARATRSTRSALLAKPRSRATRHAAPARRSGSATGCCWPPAKAR